jgi:hypothetical protein
VEPPDQIVNRNCQGSRRESERRTNGQSTMEASVIRTRKWDRLHKRVGNASSVPLHFLRRRTSRSRAALSLVRSPCIVSLDPWPPRHPRVPTCSMQNTEFNPTSQLCLVQISDTTPPRSTSRASSRQLASLAKASGPTFMPYPHRLCFLLRCRDADDRGADSGCSPWDGITVSKSRGWGDWWRGEMSRGELRGLCGV